MNKHRTCATPRRPQPAPDLFDWMEQHLGRGWTTVIVAPLMAAYLYLMVMLFALITG